jgi:DNA polymerase-3 subunit delta
MSVEKILSSWKKGNFKPVYWLEGEEEYFIDRVMQYAEHDILTESEAGFNLSIFYGKDANWADVVNACMRYPMFAERQVVLLKEAQQMKDIDKLENYISRPLASTIFVVSYKEKKVDGRSKLAKILKENGEVLTTKKLYENQLPEWVTEQAADRGITFSPKAVMLLVEHVGNDLSRLSNEMEKLELNAGSQKNISAGDIEKFIGISKEYNAFELQDAIARKDLVRAIKIINYFEQNPRANPIQLILPSVYNYFSKLATAYALPEITEQSLKPLFYNNIFAARQALDAVKQYSYPEIEKVILLLHHYNLRSIGIHDNGTAHASLLKELAVKMISREN